MDAIRWCVIDVCTGVNECQYSNGECSQVCVDTYDSYYCSCWPGYRLAYFNYSCPGNMINCYELVSPQSQYYDLL